MNRNKKLLEEYYVQISSTPNLELIKSSFKEEDLFDESHIQNEKRH